MTFPAASPKIETRCQKCGTLVEFCKCGEERQLPDRAADDFSFIRRRLEEITREKNYYSQASTFVADWPAIDAIFAESKLPATAENWEMAKSEAMDYQIADFEVLPGWSVRR
jgi:hypothetical protein